MTTNPIKTITLTAIIDAGSLNYDEGLSVISPLKKINTGNGTYVYMSPQAFKYSLYQVCKDQFKWNLSTVEAVGKGDKKVTQKVSSIIESEEVDLFGTMVTFSGSSGYKREAVVRVIPTVSVFPYKADKELLTNMGLSSRIENNDNNMATIEQHRGLYQYSITIDYDRIGKDDYKIVFENNKDNKKMIDEIDKLLEDKKKLDKPALIGILFDLLENKKYIGDKNKADYLKQYKEKIQSIEVDKNATTYCFKIALTETEINKRVNDLLDGLFKLHRDIRGRREDLSPIFCIATKGSHRLPIFSNIVGVSVDPFTLKPQINIEQIKAFCMKEGLGDKTLQNLETDKSNEPKQHYIIGLLPNKFNNNDIQCLPKDVLDFLKMPEKTNQ